MDARSLAIHSIETALEDKVSFRDMEDIIGDSVFIGKERTIYAKAAHLALHFVADRSIRRKDPEYDSIYRERLNHELNMVREA